MKISFVETQLQTPLFEIDLIVNKLTGEVNRMRDDGINYLHDLLIVPPDEVAKVRQTIEQGASPFGRQGTAQ